jgi:environmental stress-induced protein Ves
MNAPGATGAGSSPDGGPPGGTWRVLRFADCRVMPWKNGGGATTELLVSPPGADLATFDWRVSMADVGADGPFSAFPGIDRTLAIVAGAGLRLAVGDRPPVVCRKDTTPFAFEADVATAATLLDGPVTDLNVMSRRGRVEHGVRVLDLKAGDTVAKNGPTLLLIARGGPAGLASGAQAARLAERDALVLEGPGRAMVRAEKACSLFAIEIRPIGRELTVGPIPAPAG